MSGYLAPWMLDAWRGLAAAGVLVGSGIATYLKYGKPTIDRIARARQWFMEVGAMARAEPQRREDMKAIRYELSANGGGSLKDAVRDIQRTNKIQEGLLRSRIEASPDIAVYMDRKGEIESVTAGYTELTGLDTPSAKRERWKEAIAPDDVERVVSAWHESLRTETVFVCEFRFRNLKKRTTTPVRAVASPVLIGNEVVQWACVITVLAESIVEPDEDFKSAMVHIDPASLPKFIG